MENSDILLNLFNAIKYGLENNDSIDTEISEVSIKDDKVVFQIFDEKTGYSICNYEIHIQKIYDNIQINKKGK